MANKRRSGMRQVQSIPHSKRVGNHSARVTDDRARKRFRIENAEKMRLYGLKAIERKSALYAFSELLNALGIDIDGMSGIYSHYMDWENKRADKVRNSG